MAVLEGDQNFAKLQSVNDICRWAPLTRGLSSWRALASTTLSSPPRFTLGIGLNWLQLYQMVTTQSIGVFAMDELRQAVHVELWGLEEGEEREEQEEEGEEDN